MIATLLNGMVMLLLDALFPGEEPSFHRELLTAYIVDDLQRQEQRRDPQRGQDNALVQRIQRVMVQVLQLSASATQQRRPTEQQEALEQAEEQVEEGEPSRSQEQVDVQQALDPLFALMAQLRHHPELISVARDFIHELAPDG